MEEQFRQAVVIAWRRLPDGCRNPPATEEELCAFEAEFGPIPPEFRWFLSACGGGVCGSEWIDSIDRLLLTHRKFRAEHGTQGWKMQDVFVIGWDGSGNPYGIHRPSGKLLVEDHNFTGIHEVASSFQSFLTEGFGIRQSSD
jgi:hypothetical protein